MSGLFLPVSDDKKNFFISSIKTQTGDYLFGYNGGESRGMYRDTESYVSRAEAMEIIAENPSWVSTVAPNAFPNDRPGSYFYLLDFSQHKGNTKKDISNDFLIPWSTTRNSKIRITPKWEKHPIAEDRSRCIRVSKSRNPQFEWIKRMMVFESGYALEGAPTSLVFYQYVIESHRDYLENMEKSLNEASTSLDLSYANSYQSVLVEPESIEANDFLETSSSSSCPNQSSFLNQTLFPTDPFSEIMLQFQESYRSIQENLAGQKRLYMETNDLERMRTISSKCEKLAALEKETQDAAKEILAKTNKKIHKILGEVEEPPEKTLRIFKSE